ncbi:MAG: hypothetical protein RJS97_08450 [Parvibaculaceae bacterium]
MPITNPLLLHLFGGLGENNRERLYLAAHSMGGIVALRGIVDTIQSKMHVNHPLTDIACLNLHATPQQGSMAANVIGWPLRLTGIYWVMRSFLPVQQLWILRKGAYLKALAADVKEHFGGAQPSTNMKIYAVAGKYDFWVSMPSAQGHLNTSEYYPVQGGHQSMKRPEDHLDPRYLAFKVNLEAHVAESLTTLCRAIKSASTPEARRPLWQRFDAHYHKMIARCAETCFGDRLLSDRDIREVALAFVDMGSRGGLTPQQIFNAVVTDITYKDDPRLLDDPS